ncbi:MAG TPA: helix-hairpin-helix domain-containing protein [Caulobacteraceae bacterium]|jgi:predicted flap endonuclease-1-like 5' DNA nuclease|nr:helix-hairpin-helix domain-containing protein [Caulobacteraceae bacterium]
MALSQEWSHEFPGATAAGERAELALRLPLGVASPLWAMFGAAAGAGIAYWWMTSWTRAVNIEAFSPFAPRLAAAQRTRVELVAEPEVEPSADVAPAPEAAQQTTAASAPDPVLAEVVTAVADATVDDLTRMTGIGPKLAAALAERGVTGFAQIAAWTAADLARMDRELSLKGRAVREAWVAQAKRLSTGG